VDHDLDVVVVGDRKTAVDRRRRRAPVFVQLQRAGAGLDHFLERRRAGGITLAGEAEIDRKIVGRLDHPRQVPRAGRAGGRERAVRWAGAAAEHRGDAGHQRLVDLLRTDEVDMGVKAAGGEDFTFARDNFGSRSDNDGHAGLDVRIAGLADGENVAVLDADIGFDDAPMIEDQRVGDNGVDGALFVGDLRLAHAVANHFATAEFHFVAVDREIFLDFDNQIGVGEPHAITCCRAEHIGVDGAAYVRWHHGPRRLLRLTRCASLRGAKTAKQTRRLRRSALLRFTRNEHKEIPNVIPTALHNRVVARFFLHRTAAGVFSLSDRSRLVPPDERGRQGQIGLVLKPLPVSHQALMRSWSQSR
jgi:hypothetical protein